MSIKSFVVLVPICPNLIFNGQSSAIIDGNRSAKNLEKKQRHSSAVAVSKETLTVAPRFCSALD